MSFATTSQSFFDELSSILDKKQSEKEEHMNKTDARPFSSMLTQDEEPIDDGNPNRGIAYEEPEVVTRSY